MKVITLPSTARNLNNKAITTMIFVVVLGVVSLTVSCLSEESELQPQPQKLTSAVTDTFIERLPPDYSSIEQPKPDILPLAPAPAPLPPNEIQKLLVKLQKERIERRARALQAPSSFPLPENSSYSRKDKELPASSNPSSPTILSERLAQPPSPYVILAGTVIPALMLTGINSDLPGTIVAQVSIDVLDSVSQEYTLIPQGARVLGAYGSSVRYGQDRVFITWERLIFPNGQSISLGSMPGIDPSGKAGFADQVNNHYGKLATGILFSSLLSASAQMADGRNTYATSDPRYSDLATQGVARNVNEVGQRITERNLDIPPTIEITPGYRMAVMVTKDMILEPQES